jgi:hypothetical protein
MGILLAATGWMGIGPLGEYRARKAAIDEMFATARTRRFAPIIRLHSRRTKTF